MDITESMLTTEDIALYLKVDVVTVRRLVSRGELAAYRVGSEYRFTEADIREYLGRQYLPVSALFRTGQQAALMPSTTIAHDILTRLFSTRKVSKGSKPIGERFTERAANALSLAQGAAERQRCARI